MIFSLTEIARLVFMPRKLRLLLTRLLARFIDRSQMRNKSSTTLYASIATNSENLVRKKARSDRLIVSGGSKTLISEEEWLSVHEISKFRQIAEILVNEAAPGQTSFRILEIGVGEGRTAQLIKNACHNIDPNIDITWHGVDLTFERINNLKVDFDLKVAMANGAELPFSDNSFDIVYTHHVLEQIPRDFRKVIFEASRVGRSYLCMEPTIEVADLEGKINMVVKDHVVGIPKFLRKNFPQHRTVIPVVAAKAINPTVYYVMNSTENRDAGTPDYICPYSKQQLGKAGGMLQTQDGNFAYPIINDIPLLCSQYRINISKNKRLESI